jgi:flagellar motor switch protein FliN/FliY
MADMLSQEEINALLGGAGSAQDSDETAGGGAGEGGPQEITDEFLESLLTSQEKDVLGEVGNISMGTSATTLFALLGERVIITTPYVEVIRLEDVAKNYERPCVGIRVDYTQGIKGTNVLLLAHHDVKVITSLMMGWGGEINEDEELNDMDISAIQEAMNQMIGSSSTSLASLVNTKIDIAPPKAAVLDFSGKNLFEDLGFEEQYVVSVQFRMEIGTLVDSNIMQLLPMCFARQMVDSMTSFMTDAPPPMPQPTPAPAPQPAPAPPPAPSPQPVYPPTEVNMTQAQAPPPYYPPQEQYQPPPQGYYPPPQYAPMPQHVAAQTAQFQAFDMKDFVQQKENIEIVMDVPLEVTVELGRTTRKIKEILSFSPGSIIELNKLAGEPIDILVNGKHVAKGEVVVIDENFGIRVTDIINVEHRI